MKKLLRLCFFIICAGAFLNTEAQNTGDYQSAATGDWSAPATWQIYNGSAFVAAGVAPASSDGVIKIRTGHIVTVNSGITVDQVIVNTGGTLTQTSTITMADGTGDDITVNGNYIFVGGVLNGSGLLKVNGSMNWQSGTLNTNLELATGSSGSKTTAGNASINSSFGNPVFTNNGSFTWADGNFDLNYGSISNGVTGVITATGNNVIGFSGGNHNFNNAGSFIKNTGTGITAININGTSTGSFTVNAGTISSGATFTNTGSINIGSGKTFLVNGGNFTLGTGSNSNGAGNFEVTTAGIITITSPTATPATASNFLFSGGDISGADICSFMVTGGMEWRTGSMHTNVILAAGSVSSKTTVGNANINSQFANPVFTNNGSFTWADGNFDLNYGSISNGTTGIITATGNNIMGFSGGNHSFNNAGSFIKNTGTGITVINVNGSSTGSFNVNTGTISSGATFTNTGSIKIASGKTFLVNGGNLTLGTGSNSNGAGNFEVATAGIITITSPTTTPATASNFLFSGGNISGADNCSFMVTGGMEWRTGSMHTNVILAAGSVSSKTTAGDANITSQFANPVFTNNGSFTWIDGDFVLNYGSISNGVTGVITATGNNRITPSGGNYSFNNAGIFSKTNAPGTTTFNVGTTNSGSIKGIGTMNFAGGFTNHGIIAPGTSPGILTVNGAQPLSANSTLNIELLNGSGAGTGHDQLSKDESLTLAGTLTVVETGTVPAGVYTIINCTSGTINGNFTSVNLPPCYTLQVNSTNVQLTKTLPPKPTITASGPLTFCQGDSVILTSSAASGNIWSNGATTQSITVTSSGNFSVTRTNSSGCTSNPSAAQIVTVNPLPQIPTITASSDTICDGDSVILTSSAASGNLWSNGDTAQNITVTASGSFSVTTTNASGCASASSAIKTITVNPLPETPVIVADGSTVKVCPGKMVTLTSSAASSYEWNTGATSQSIIVSQAGNYSVTAANANGCQSLGSNIIAVTYRDCAKPVELLTSNITATSAKLSWTPVTCAVSYQYELRIKGTNAYTVKQQTGVKRTIKGLLPNTIYQWRVKTICSVSPDTIKSAKYSKGPEFTTASAVSAGDLVEDIKASATHLNAIISPNPAHSMATVKLMNATGAIQIKLADISGKMMWENTYVKNQITFSIDVSKLAQGMYMVIIKDENETKVIKLVKE